MSKPKIFPWLSAEYRLLRKADNFKPPLFKTTWSYDRLIKKINKKIQHNSAKLRTIEKSTKSNNRAEAARCKLVNHTLNDYLQNLREQRAKLKK